MPPSLLESNSGDQLLWLIVGGCAVALLLGYVLIRPARRRRDPLARDPSMPSPAQQRAVEREVHTLLSELSDMARQIGEQLDARTSSLERLLAQADEKIHKLEMLSSATAAPEAVRRRIDAPPSRLPPESPATESRHAEVYALAEQGRGIQEIAQQLNRPSGEIELILALRPRT